MDLKRPLEDADTPCAKRSCSTNPRVWEWDELSKWISEPPRNFVLPLYIKPGGYLSDGAMLLEVCENPPEAVLAAVIENPCHLAFVHAELTALFGLQPQPRNNVHWEVIIDWFTTKTANKIPIRELFQTNGILTVHMLELLYNKPEWLTRFGLDTLKATHLRSRIRMFFWERELNTALVITTTNSNININITEHEATNSNNNNNNNNNKTFQVTHPTVKDEDHSSNATMTKCTVNNNYNDNNNNNNNNNNAIKLFSPMRTPANVPQLAPVVPPLLINHIVMMHALPLVFVDRNDPVGTLKHVDQLDLKTEERTLCNMKFETRSAVHLSFTEATIANFDEAADCCILHLSGHGVAASDHSPAALLFETADGKAKFVTADDLRGLLMPGGRQQSSIQCVVLSTCSSMAFSNVFLEAGVGCVIVTTDEVEDKFAQKFTESFYKRIFADATKIDLYRGIAIDLIRKAFDAAKARVGAESKSDAEKFQIHPPTFATPVPATLVVPTPSLSGMVSLNTVSSATQLPHLQLEPNRWQNTPHTGAHYGHGVHNGVHVTDELVAHTVSGQYTTKLSTNVDHFLGREIDMHKILTVLCDHTQRLVHIKGAIGIGKSALMRGLALYMDKRKHWRDKFSDGIYFVDLQDRQSLEAVNEAMFEAVKSQRRDNHLFHDDMPFLDPLSFRERLRSCACLFFLDGCDSALEAESRNDFGSFMQKYLDMCHDIKFVCTSRKVLPQISGHVPSYYDLPDLSAKACSELLHKCTPRRIGKDEVAEASRTGCDGQLVLWMSQHPASILVAARMLDRRTLNAVAEKLQQLNKTPLPNAETSDPQLIKLECTLDSVYSRLSLEARRFYKFLGLLPMGASEAILNLAFGSKGNWERQLNELMDHSIVMSSLAPNVTAPDVIGESQTRYKHAFHYMTAHAQKQAHHDNDGSSFDPLEFHVIVCKFYAERCETVRRVWFVRNREALQWLQEHERNLWECVWHAEAHSSPVSVSAKQQALNEAHNYPATVGIIASTFCDMLRRKERKTDTKKAASTGLQVCRAHRNLHGEARCLLAESKNEAEARKIELSRQLLIKAIAIFSFVSDNQSYLEALNLLVNQKIRFGAHYDADKLVSTLDGFQKQHPDASQQLYGVEAKARTDVVLNVTPLTDRIIELAEQQHDEIAKANALLYKGQTLIRTCNENKLADASKVRGMYEAALGLFRANHDSFGEAEAYYHLAQLHHKLKDKITALDRYKRARDLFDNCQAIVNKLNMTRTIAEINFEIAKFNSSPHQLTEVSMKYAKQAEKLLYEARDHFNKFGRRFGEGASMRILGELFFWLASYPASVSDVNDIRKKAAQYLEQAKKCFEEMECNEPTPQGVRMQLRVCKRLLEIHCLMWSGDSIECKIKAGKVFEEAEMLVQNNPNSFELDDPTLSIAEMRKMHNNFIEQLNNSNQLDFTTMNELN